MLTHRHLWDVAHNRLYMMWQPAENAPKAGRERNKERMKTISRNVLLLAMSWVVIGCGNERDKQSQLRDYEMGRGIVGIWNFNTTNSTGARHAGEVIFENDGKVAWRGTVVWHGTVVDKSGSKPFEQSGFWVVKDGSLYSRITNSTARNVHGGENFRGDSLAVSDTEFSYRGSDGILVRFIKKQGLGKTKKPAVFELRLVEESASAETEEVIMTNETSRESMPAREVLNVRLVPLLDQTSVKMADAVKPPNSSITNPYIYVRIVFTDQGRELIARITRKYIGKRIAVVVGEEVLMAPYIKTAITSGTLHIAGRHTEEESKRVVARINEAVKK